MTKHAKTAYPANSANSMPEMRAGSTSDWFGRVAAGASSVVGSRWAFLLAVLTILAWGISGPIYHYSDTWQLVINTGTTIVTFLMVFLIQNTQNRDAKAIHLKLDELICSIDAARNQMIAIEQLPDSELAQIAGDYAALHQEAVISEPVVNVAVPKAAMEQAAKRSAENKK